MLTAAALALGLQHGPSAAEPCATVASAPFGLTLRYGSGKHEVVTNLGDQRYRIDFFARDGTSRGSGFTIAGVFLIETVSEDGQASIAHEHSPAAETLLPLTQGAEQTFDFTSRARSKPTLYYKETFRVLETGSIHLPTPDCDLDITLLGNDKHLGSGVVTMHSVHAPSLGVAFSVVGPVQLADVSYRRFPIAIERNTTRPEDRRELLLAQSQSKIPPWLADLDQCPADLLPGDVVPLDYYPKRCVAFPEQCLDSCKSGDANSCYSVALAFQELRDSPLSEALFLHACSLGIVSGCVNRAAAMPVTDAECQVRTFAKACSLEDPWGCTMFGAHALNGLGMTADIPRARKALKAACALDPDGQPCLLARKLLKEPHGKQSHE